MNRRTVLKTAAAAALLPLLTSPLAALAQQAGPRARSRTLLLVELKGGNDGLNTLVPYGDPLYARERPNLAIKADDALPLGDRLGFNPVLRPLMEPWDKGELAIVRGVGYPQPNRSHFRSIEIWETASRSEEILREGWIAAVLKGNVGMAADGIVIGDYEFGPLAGGKMRNVIVDRPDQFIAQAQRLRAARESDGAGALGHILRVRAELLQASAKLAPLYAAAPEPAAEFPSGNFANQLRTAAQLIQAEAGVPVLKVSLGSFDTHVNQRGQHDNLLRQLAEGLVAFRQAMIAAGRWNDVLVLTYSEFGRRIRENASRGTDHGTAAPQFVLGGRVKGGFHGAQPNLEDLDAGDLRFAVDYRALYATVVRNWWGMAGDIGRLGAFKPLPLLA